MGITMPAEFDIRRVPDGYIADPYCVLADLRTKAPVYPNPDGSFVLTRYADIEHIYRDPVLWSSPLNTIMNNPKKVQLSGKSLKK